MPSSKAYLLQEIPVESYHMLLVFISTAVDITCEQNFIYFALS